MNARTSKNLRNSVLALALTFVIAGCSALEGVNVGTGVNLPGGIGVGANKTIGRGQEPSRSGKKEKEPAKAGVKLYVFDCGLLRIDDISAFGLANTDTDVRQLFVPCYLIEHPTEGRLLWDAGLPLTLVGKGIQTEDGMTQEYRESLLDQLRDMRVSPSDVDYVAFSHMHFDHVGAANEFANATLLIQEPEYEAAFKHAADNPIFDYDLYKELVSSTKTLLSGDHDVFGDGTVQIISTPGHTPGHQVLYVELNKTGPLVLGGDLYHFQASRRLRAVPEFNTDREQTLASMDKVESLINVTNATLWIEHDLALAIRLRVAPSYYD